MRVAKAELRALPLVIMIGLALYIWGPVTPSQEVDHAQDQQP
jgi:hypothetical protein